MASGIVAQNWEWIGPRAGAMSLVLARIAGVCWTAPGLTASGLGWRLRLGLVFTLGVLIVPIVAPTILLPPGPTAAAWALLSEVLAGAMLGWSGALVLAGARQAGDLVSAQAGLSTSSLFDPETGDAATPLGHFHGLFALAVFLALDGPLVLVRALIRSYRDVPPGESLILAETAMMAFAQLGRALELALRAAAPAAIALTLVGLILAWLARSAPMLPFAALGLSIRSILGITLIGLGLAALATTLAHDWRMLPWWN
jgi:flagellar biosynthesis protein FliR